MTAPAACAACNGDERRLSTAIEASAAASADPCISQRVDDTFRKAQTERRATQLLTAGEASSPSQLDQPSRRGCGAVPSRWASTVVPGASGAKKRLAAQPRARRSPLTKFFRSRQGHYTPYRLISKSGELTLTLLAFTHTPPHPHSSRQCRLPHNSAPVS